jgi:glycerol kinase
MDGTLIGIDAGTTGVTCVLFDEGLRPLARTYREYPQHYPRPGEVEHDATELLGALDEALAELCAAPRADEARAIGVTNQRETVFPLERSTGRALRRGIVWQDRRTAERCAELRAQGLGPEVAARTGLVLDPYFSGTKIEWMLENEDGLRARAEAGEVVFVTVDTLVINHLTEGTLATDPTNASRTMLYDIDEQRWAPRLLELFGVREEWLPEVRPSTGAFGEARLPTGRSVPVHGVAGDQQAALHGQGCWDEGQLKVTVGTGCFLLLNTGVRRAKSEGGLLTTLAAGRTGEVVYALEGSVFVGGAVIQWLRDELDFFDDAAESEALARSVPDAGGVHLVPAFTGLGAPHWDPDARGAVLGITRGTGRAHVARAALEAIAFQNVEVIELLRSETGLRVDELLIDGGATANTLLMQLQADLARARVVRPAEAEATARGAAALAGVGAGLLADPGEAAVFSDAPRVFEPGIAPEEALERLSGWREAVGRVLTR